MSTIWVNSKSKNVAILPHFFLAEYYSGLWNNDVGRFWFDEETRYIATLMIAKFPSPWFVIRLVFKRGYVFPFRTRKSAMDDSGQDLKMLTWAVVQTIKKLSDPVRDPNIILQKTKTGR